MSFCWMMRDEDKKMKDPHHSTVSRKNRKKNTEDQIQSKKTNIDMTREIIRKISAETVKDNNCQHIA